MLFRVGMFLEALWEKITVVFNYLFLDAALLVGDVIADKCG